MLNKETLTLDFYDAVITNDGALVKKILTEYNKEAEISAKVITGILVIALENHLFDSAREILSYNETAMDKISDEHLNNILCLASKEGALKNLNITFH